MAMEKKATKAENLESANHWLEKGIEMEKQGKGEKMVNRCLDIAVQYEGWAYE